MTRFLTLAVIVFTAQFALAADSGEIVERHLEAIGGKARWQKVQSLLIKGTNSFSSSVWVWKQGGKVRTEERDNAYSGKTLVTAFDGKSGWISNPFRGPNPGVPRAMTAEELRRWQTGLAIRSDLLDLPQGSKVELLGNESVGGKSAYKLSVARPGLDPVTLWIDASTYLIVQRARTNKDPMGKPATSIVRVSDYRNVGGVLIPHANGETRYVVEINPPVDDALFAPPKPNK